MREQPLRNDNSRYPGAHISIRRQNNLKRSAENASAGPEKAGKRRASHRLESSYVPSATAVEPQREPLQALQALLWP